MTALLLGRPLPAQEISGLAGNSAASTSLTVADKLGINTTRAQPVLGEMSMLADSGVRWVRMDFDWTSTERVRAQYDFSAYDRLVSALEASHLRALFTFDYANPLYDQNLSPASDEGRAAFASWAAAAVAHFRGHGFLWEIYNEPNSFWSPRPNTNDYVKLALATSEAIAEAAPDEKLIGPGSAVIDPPFLEACFRAGLLNYWSAVSIHPYRQKDPETAADDFLDVRLLIRKYAPPNKLIPVIVGEWGYSSLWPGMDERKQAAMLSRSWLTDLANDVLLTIWYVWPDGADPRDPNAHFGLVGPFGPSEKSSENTPFRPKPAYLAARTLTQTLGTFQFNKRLALNSADDYVLLFTKGDSIRLAVWTTASPHSAELPASPGEFAVAGVTGEQLPPVESDRHGLRVALTSDPQYLEPKEPNELLSIAAAWQRLPLEIEVRAPAVLPLHFSLVNPFSKSERFVLGATGAPFEAEESAKVKPGATADLMIRVAASERSLKPSKIAVGLAAGKLGVVAQETSIVASNPLRVTLLPATARYLPVSIVNLSDDPVRGTLRAFGTGLRFECSRSIALSRDCAAREMPVQMVQGVKERIVQVPLASPPKSEYSAGVDIVNEDRDRIYNAPASSFRLVGDFVGESLAVSNYSLTAEGGASPGNLEAKSPSQGPPQQGMAVLRIAYDLKGASSALRLVGKDNAPIPGQPQALGLWLDGDKSGVPVYLRFVDSTGQAFQEGGGPLNWKGWRYVLVFMDPSRGKHWGGANDGVIHYPIHWDSLLVIQNPPGGEVSGNLFVSGPVLIYGLRHGDEQPIE